jgi:putative dimethyl sulfoxide reductase chaperone
MEGTALADIAQHRSQTYWLLSRLILEAPSLSLFGELGAVVDGVPADEVGLLAEETGALLQAIRAVDADPAAIEVLDVERTRLFAGLTKDYGAPPPFESVARENKLPGESTIAVAGLYAEAGFDPPAPEAGPPDHLGAELRFMALLCYREAEMWRTGDRASAGEWVERERVFLDDHLLQWVPQHCEHLLALAQTPYHRALITLIARACLIDRDDVIELAVLAAEPQAPA